MFKFKDILSVFIRHDESLRAGAIRCSRPEKRIGSITVIVESRQQECVFINCVHFARHLRDSFHDESMRKLENENEIMHYCGDNY